MNIQRFVEEFLEIVHIENEFVVEDVDNEDEFDWIDRQRFSKDFLEDFPTIEIWIKDDQRSFLNHSMLMLMKSKWRKRRKRKRNEWISHDDVQNISLIDELDYILNINRLNMLNNAIFLDHSMYTIHNE